jgi:hypothetical protein
MNENTSNIYKKEEEFLYSLYPPCATVFLGDFWVILLRVCAHATHAGTGIISRKLNASFRTELK